MEAVVFFSHREWCCYESHFQLGLMKSFIIIHIQVLSWHGFPFSMDFSYFIAFVLYNKFQTPLSPCFIFHQASPPPPPQMWPRRMICNDDLIRHLKSDRILKPSCCHDFPRRKQEKHCVDHRPIDKDEENKKNFALIIPPWTKTGSQTNSLDLSFTWSLLLRLI